MSARAHSFLPVLTALAAVAPVRADAPPAWTALLRTEARAVHDSNVFLQDAAPLLAGQTVRGAPVAAAATETIAGFAATLRHRAADAHPVAAEIGYGFEWHRFDAWRGESHRDHRLVATVSTTTSEGSAEAKLTVLTVDGSRESPVYNEEGGTPAIGGEPIRARRAQTLTTFTAVGEWSAPPAWRLRSHLAATAQDFHTFHRSSPTGCANYVDRAYALAGIDAGHPLAGDLTFWFSLRAGRQWQSNLLGRAENFSNTFLRPLAGLDGKLAPALHLTVWVGPSYHRYTAERRTGTTATRTQPYYDAKLSWTPTPTDTVTLGGRQHLALGSAGRSAYREIRTDAAWTHRLTPALDSALRGGAFKGNFAGFTATPRNDTIFTASAALGERLTSALRLEAGLTREWSQTRVPATAGRAYTRWLATFGATWTW